MSEKPPIKRGILSSLMGLFGEEEEQAAEASQANGSDTHEPKPSTNGDAQPESPPVEDHLPQPVAPSSVVRESYEPGWYAVSSARTGRSTSEQREAVEQDAGHSATDGAPGRWGDQEASSAQPDADVGSVSGHDEDQSPGAAVYPFPQPAVEAAPTETFEPPLESPPVETSESAPSETLESPAGETFESSPQEAAVPPPPPEAQTWDVPPVPEPDVHQWLAEDQPAEAPPEPGGFRAQVAGWEPAAMPEAEPVAEAEPVVVAEPQPEPEPVAVAEPEHEPVVEAEPEHEPVVEAEPEPEHEPVVEAEPEHEPVAEAEPEPGTAEEPVAEPVVEAEPEHEPVVEAEPEHEPVVEADAAPESDATESSGDQQAADEAPSVDTVEVVMTAPEQEVSSPPVHVEPDGLASRSAANRRRALEEMMARGIDDSDVPAIASLLQDPERGVRLLALEALVARADAVERDAVAQALRDPAEEVRAAAVRLAAARSSHDVPELFSFVADRQWPVVQQAALEALPASVAAHGVTDGDLDSMLSAIAGMDSLTNAGEPNGFASLARAVGRDRLVASMQRVGPGRPGAARLLLEEGSPESLRSLATYADDPDAEVARTARTAADLVGPEAEEQPEDQAPPAEMVGGVDAGVDTHDAGRGEQGEVISGLARALDDPDEGVRGRAAEALRSTDRWTLVDWTRSAVQSPDAERVVLGAHVAEVAGLSEVSAELLARGATAAPEAQGSLGRALASFGMDPGTLVDLAQGVEGASRPEAIRMLWLVGGRSLLPALHPLLEDSSAAVRVAALEVFGESGDAQTIEVAQRVLERDSSPVVRATAISVIGRAGQDQRVTALAQAMADPDPDVRATAVEVLPAGMGRQASELLLEALSDQDERVWQAAIRHLASVPDRDRSIVWTAIERCPATRREHLVATLERSSAERLALLALDHLASPDAAERTLAITLAGRAGTPECVRGIITALQDPAPTVRRVAASALLSLRSAESIAGLARALSDPDVEVRVEAVRALSVIDDDNVLDPLITALKDPEMRVREVAGEAVVRWRSPAVARRLAIALTNPSLRRPAGEVLARMGSSAVDPLVDILMEDDSELAGTVGQLLESLVGPELFLTRLGSMNPDDRLRAVEALGAIKGERGTDGLARALSDPVESIRIRAVTLLGEIGDDRAFEAVKRTFLGDPVLEVVQAAEEALRRLQASADQDDGAS